LTAAGLAGPLAARVFGATSKRSHASGAVPLNVTESGGEATTTTGTANQPNPPTTTSTTPSVSTTATPTPETATGPLVVTPEATPSPSGAPAVAVQRKQQPSKAPPAPQKQTTTTNKAKPPAANPAATAPGALGNKIAAAPQLVAAQAGVLAAELAGSAASVQALAFYRIPLFLLPIYQAAAAQYGVPWQILAAINEIETDYGNDLSVSTAGAVGWMQFMPATWIQYGVDALDAGYADPYNPVDAIFAAARYLRAAGASSNLRAAILAYNHSAEYVSSVLLRAKLISSYPNPVIAALTGLTDGRLPVRNGQLAWDSIARLISPSSATAQATALNGSEALGAGALAGAGEPAAHASSARPPAPGAASSAARAHPAAPPLQLLDLATSPNATVVAVQDGRVTKIGASRALGRYVVLRDVYGDVFTYAGLGSIAPTYRAKPPSPPSTVSGAALPGAPGSAALGAQSAGTNQPLTLHVAAHAARGALSAHIASRAASPAVPAGKLRLFAHPGNPDALAVAAARAGAHGAGAKGASALRVGAIVSKGTVIGHVDTPVGARAGHMRFAIRPAGDLDTVDPRPILENWSQLAAALHPQGVKGEPQLLGATASGVFLLSKGELQRDVLSDPGISIPACGRQEIAQGSIDRRVLAALAFLSRSGLKPTVSALRCTASGLPSGDTSGASVEISAIDGIALEGHQGPGTITDVAIRTLLTLRGEFHPRQILSLMQYPGTPATLASEQDWQHVRLVFSPLRAAAQASPAAAAAAAHSARRGAPAPAPVVVGGELSSTQWNQLFTQIGTLHAPSVPVTRSSVAVPDRPAR
jgi:murein DD-endopeptidase MepM/ murein hydrolase activator NlpD